MNIYMKSLTKIESKSLGFYLIFLAITAVGIYLRLDQFTLQVLLDDEWHVVHQLLVKGPKELFLTFGRSDFSIPLALFYWLELKLFGLSEAGMRWPMMLAGLATLLVLPLYVRKFFSDQVALLFAALLGVSPMLLIYSRTARPYALTLLLSILAVGAFHKFVGTEKASFKLGLVYMICAVASAWLHLISLALVIAPFLTFGAPALLHRNWSEIGRIFWLGFIMLAVLLAVVLPPLMSHPEALFLKLGAQTPTAGTILGALFVWFGTGSKGVVLVGVVLAIYGFKPLWRDFPLSRSFILGLGLTCGLILFTQPAWVQHPLTLARYLLPVIPLLLLAISIAVFQLAEMLAERLDIGSKRNISFALSVLILLFVVYYSPLPKILTNPNSNSLHSVYQFDFRNEKNLVALYQKDFPVSQFWHKLASFPRDSIKIAAGPFSFETQHWDAARWEQISHQRVMPGYLDGFCAENRWGEVPNDQRFRFKNVGYLSEKNDLVSRGFDLVIYQKPFKVKTYQGEKEFGMETAGCETIIREQFPTPIYEDRWLMVISLTDKVKRGFDAAR